jgi:hypothetical protein
MDATRNLLIGFQQCRQTLKHHFPPRTLSLLGKRLVKLTNVYRTIGSCPLFPGHGHPSVGVNEDESRVYAVCFRRIVFRGDR